MKSVLYFAHNGSVNSTAFRHKFNNRNNIWEIKSILSKCNWKFKKVSFTKPRVGNELISYVFNLCLISLPPCTVNLTDRSSVVDHSITSVGSTIQSAAFVRLIVRIPSRASEKKGKIILVR